MVTIAQPSIPSASTCKNPRRDPYYDWAKMGVVPPYVFAQTVLGMNLYDWQLDALDATGQRLPVSLCAANESGKTTRVIAAQVLWFLAMFGERGGRLVGTSGSWLQVTSQLLPALERFKGKFPRWEWLSTEIRTGLGGAIFFSTDNAGRAEGHHALNPYDAPLFYLVDEAKSVGDGIFSAIDRCGPQFLLMVSSAGAPSGKFYRTHTNERALYWTRKVTSEECPHLDPAKRERDRAIYGDDSPIFRSIHYSEFSSDGSPLVCDPVRLGAALECLPEKNEVGTVTAFCDFAAGGDENVLAIRRGNHVWIEDAWRDADTVQAVRRFIARLRDFKITPAQTFGDASGLGHAMICQFKDEGFPITGVNNGDMPTDGNFAHLGAEIWWSSVRRILKGEIHLRPDPVLFEQMTTRRAHWTARHKLGVESKEDMASRGIKSPDRADAIFGALYCGPHLSGTITTTEGILLPSIRRQPATLTIGRRATRF